MTAPFTVVTTFEDAQHFSGAVADVFTHNTLTISAHDDERTLATFADGRWLRATTFDGQGWPLYSHIADYAPSPRPWTREQAEHVKEVLR